MVVKVKAVVEMIKVGQSDRSQDEDDRKKFFGFCHLDLDKELGCAGGF